jgi:hypothetical protein
VLSLAALVAGALLAAGLMVGGALPAARVFAVTFAGVVGALALLLALRAGRVRLPASGPEVAVAGLAGVAAAVAGTAYFLARYPEATRHLTPGMAVLLAAVLGGCLWLTLAPPRALATQRLPVGIAVGTAVVAAGGVLLTSRLLSGDAAALTLFYALQLPLVAVFSGSVIMAATRGYRAGLQTTVWTALLTSLAIFAVAVPEAARSFQLEQTLIYFGDRIPPDAAGESLRLATWGLLLFPFWWLPFGLMGAGLAAWAARRTARPRVG